MNQKPANNNHSEFFLKGQSRNCQSLFNFLSLTQQKDGIILYDTPRVARIALSRTFLEMMSNIIQYYRVDHDILTNFFELYLHNGNNNEGMNGNLNNQQINEINFGILNGFFSQNAMENQPLVTNFLHNNPNSIGAYVYFDISDTIVALRTPLQPGNNQIQCGDF